MEKLNQLRDKEKVFFRSSKYIIWDSSKINCKRKINSHKKSKRDYLSCR